MTRKEFLKISAIFGVGLPIQSTLTSCSTDDSPSPDFSGSVLIIGAGAAGLSAGYLLKQRGIDFQIIEASSTYGGRMKTTNDFADFPIPLGAEWIHTDTDIFNRIVNDGSVDVGIEAISYKNTDRSGLWRNGVLTIEDLGVENDKNFLNSSWYDFFNEYIVPTVRDKISFSHIVTTVDYSGDKVVVNTQNSEQFTADKVIVTAPLKILQNGDITFSPSLPNDKINAINNTDVWDGIKVFFEFSEEFYPTYVDFDINPSTLGQKLYFDAAYGQNTNRNILGFFCVGTPALPYTALSGNALKDFMLDELDEIFSNQASSNYIKHIEQNWSSEPFSQGAYLNDHENWREVRELSKTVADKLYFAGEAYTLGEDWGSVHNAAEAAKRAVDEITN